MPGRTNRVNDADKRARSKQFAVPGRSPRQSYVRALSHQGKTSSAGHAPILIRRGGPRPWGLMCRGPARRGTGPALSCRRQCHRPTQTGSSAPHRVSRRQRVVVHGQQRRVPPRDVVGSRPGICAAFRSAGSRESGQSVLDPSTGDRRADTGQESDQGFWAKTTLRSGPAGRVSISLKPTSSRKCSSSEIDQHFPLVECASSTE